MLSYVPWLPISYALTTHAYRILMEFTNLHPMFSNLLTTYFRYAGYHGEVVFN